jgi:hypothetical protein
MPRRPVNLTSPAASGVFLFPSALPCNRAAQAPPFAFTGRLPSALPLSSFRPVPPRLAEARPVCRPCRPPSAACDPCAARAAVPLPLPRAALCRRRAALPIPRRPSAALIGTGNPLPPACRRPRAAPEGRQPPPPPIPCRAAAVRRRKKVGFTNPR